jgi:hypothetical protein
MAISRYASVPMSEDLRDFLDEQAPEQREE